MIAALLLFGIMGQAAVADARPIVCNAAIEGIVIDPDSGPEARCTASDDGTYAWVEVTPKVANCSKYEHAVHHPAYDGSACGPNVVSCVAINIHHDAQPDTCEDDVHVITESEWQQLQTTLHVLVDMIDEKADRFKGDNLGVITSSEPHGFARKATAH